jgi:hypothetical protein
MAQPPLHPAEPFRLAREDGDYSPVEIAIRRALREDGADKRADAVRVGRPEPDGVREDYQWSKSDAWYPVRGS